MDRLLSIVRRLRDPEHGCSWDCKQDFRSLIPCTLEESYEVCEAIEKGNFDELREELGDLLLQVVFHSTIAEEEGLFDFEAVAGEICDKLVRRHPHVFGNVTYASDEERIKAWEAAKSDERRRKAEKDESGTSSILDGLTSSLPALMFASKMQRRASIHGFDWTEAAPVFDKVEEELEELRDAWKSGHQAHVREELGDLLFVTVNLARHLQVESETALREASRKFESRFRYIEEQVARSGREFDDCPLEELDAFWDEAKVSLAGKSPAVSTD